MLYLDSSAITKLIRFEAESTALRKFLKKELITSNLSKIEIYRACINYDKTLLVQADKVFNSFIFVDIDDRVINDSKKLVEIPFLRSLDAIHLATARGLIAFIDSVVTYDKKMLQAAAVLKLPTASPA